MTTKYRVPPPEITCHTYLPEDLRRMQKYPVKKSVKYNGKVYTLYMTGTKSECQRVGKKRKKLVGSLGRTIKLPTWHEHRYALYTHT